MNEAVKVLVPLAQGCEELEAITIIDLLRRASFDVTTAGLDNQPVKASRGTVLIPDMDLTQALLDKYHLFVMPGGLPGADNLANDERIVNLIQSMVKADKYVAAICAAPKVLAKAGVLEGKKATSYPGVLDSMEVPRMTCTGAAVEVDGKIVTSRGPGTAMDFALALIALLSNAETRTKVEKGLVRD